ncbi:hypothetical protein HZS_7164 [Henneguya salminicola]|nr:hypothetical protein HZS_7164 [Henneguya salminicola]
MTTLFKRLPMLPCLKQKMDGARLNAVCGDGTIDPGEDCDCGFDVLCNNFTKIGECCNRSTCKFLKPDYQCSFGQCCRKCQVRFFLITDKLTKNTLCRPAVQECSLPLFCDGNSPTCKKKYKSPDYKMCQNRNGYCYKESCLNLNYTCKIAFKSKFAYFTEDCVKHIKEIIQNNCSQNT